MKNTRESYLNWRERSQAKGLNTNRIKGNELSHRLRKEKEVRRVNKDEVLKHGFGRKVTNASAIPI